MLDQPGLALRWHVARFHAPRPSDRAAEGEVPEPWLELVVARASDYLPESLSRGGAPEQGLAEQLSWWIAEEDRLLHGWATEAAVLDVLERAPISTAASMLIEVPRRITEDMVFIQTVGDAERLDQCWSTLTEDSALPNLLPLMEISENWCDFTQPARRMAKTIYKQALKEEDDDAGPEGGRDAAKR